MIFSSGKLFRINKSLPTSVCNQGHQAMKGIELYSYDLQSNTGTSLIYICIIYHHTLYFVILIININIHYLTFQTSHHLWVFFFVNFLNSWIRHGMGWLWRWRCQVKSGLAVQSSAGSCHQWPIWQHQGRLLRCFLSPLTGSLHQRNILESLCCLLYNV